MDTTMSRYIGVSETDDGRYEARIFSEGVERSLGVYESDVEAAFVHDRTAEASRGDFAVLNFPDVVADEDTVS